MNYIAQAVENVRQRLIDLDPETDHNQIIDFFVCIRIETFLRVQFRRELTEEELEHLFDSLNDATDEIARDLCPDTFNYDSWLCNGLTRLTPIHLQKDVVSHALWLKEHRLLLLDRLAERFK